MSRNKKFITVAGSILFFSVCLGQTGKVGINTTTPQAMLHVSDSSVLFSGGINISGTPGDPPADGTGVRMMWYSDKAAFRVGRASGSDWSKDSIGNYSFAAGNNVKATGGGSVAFGGGSHAGSSSAIAVGNQSKALGTASVAMGFYVTAVEDYSTAFGYYTKASGAFSTAFGQSTEAIGNLSTTFGQSTQASGPYSVAFGQSTQAKGFNAFAIGFNTIAKPYASLVLGRYNDSAAVSTSTWNNIDPIFIIGNGTADNARSNSLTVLKNGKTGINTASPVAMLHVEDSSVVFKGGDDVSATPGNPPVSGTGVRMMWYPDKAAFRAGYVVSVNWNKDSIGDYSFASGFNTKAKGIASTAMGTLSVASGDNSTALGIRTVASGEYSTAIGMQTTASAIYSTAMGYRTSASAAYSTAMGELTSAGARGSLSLGRFNDSIAASSPSTWVDTDPVFIIGNGSSINSRRNAFIIAQNGETGINVANGMPQALLHLKAKEATYNMHIRLENFGSSDYASMVYDGDMKFRTFGAGDVYQWRDDGSNTRMQLTSTGNLSIDGTLTQNSDTRLKKNISPLQNSLQKILSIGGYHYNWIDKSRDNNLQTGLLAQEIEKQMPELVKKDEDGMKSVNYTGLTPYIIEAMKEQQQRIVTLEKQVNELKKILLQKK